MSEREFFVGYLAVPPRQRRFLIAVVTALLCLALLVAYAVGSAQLADGEGQWDPYSTANVQGYLSLDPYPVLHRADGSSVLLVRAGKLSAKEYVRSFDGRHVAIRGTPIERGGWHMLELYAAEDVQERPPTQGYDLPVRRAGEQIELAGEIIDSKCFLGVMKPGSGKVHRACAAMCLTGGMPPMLVVTDARGDRYGYMLVMSDGASASLHLVPDVAVPVTVRGRLEKRGDLTYLYIAEDGVRRLGPAVPNMKV
ncbi:MAG: hypothetical protein AAF933_07610 [Pseudomonadota bacterium]